METQQIGNRMMDYVQLYREVQREVNDENAIAVIMEQIGKDARCSMLMEQRNGNGNGFDNGQQPATSKQIGYLKALKVEVPAGLTKQQASELIEANK